MAENKKSVTRLSNIRDALINLECVAAEKQASAALTGIYREASVHQYYIDEIAEIIEMCDYGNNLKEKPC